MNELQEKAQGCLIGGAVGDALGYPVEFCDWEQIARLYGPTGITRYPKDGGIVSDDTQMTMFTAEALLRAKSDPISALTQGYKDWYSTQHQEPPRGTERLTGLLANPELYALRAPGGTCLAAIRQGCNGTIDNRINDSKGCGGIMRVAPIGIMYSDPEKAALLGAQAAALTHGHDYGILPAGILTCLISVIFNHSLKDKFYEVDLANFVIESLEIAQKVFKDTNSFIILADRVKDVVLYALDEPCYPVDLFGAGWVAEETLFIALYCAIKYGYSFEKAIIASVNHGGDSDSTGAVTGNILGAWMGINAIPNVFKENLQFKDELTEMADQLIEKRK